MDQRERMIQSCIAEYNEGKFKSIRAASKAWGLPRTTLDDRLRGAATRRVAHHHQQRLTPEQEQFLATWILEEDARGFPPRHDRAREMASCILRMNRDENPLGKRWVSGFIKRNPRIKLIIGWAIEADRVKNTSLEAIRAFLEFVEATQVQLGICTEDTYNMDETGNALGVCTNHRVLASAKKKKAYVKSPENREWVLIIECISATGRSLSPVVIFKGQALQTTWFLSDIQDWHYTTSENGWTSNAIGGHWLEHVFLPQTRPDGDLWRLLILDGHGSHVDVDFLYMAKIHKVQLVFLPSHSSHILQPLDLSCFSPIKS